jgi:hypothetical protein
LTCRHSAGQVTTQSAASLNSEAALNGFQRIKQCRRHAWQRTAKADRIVIP